jgi:hypothetical protein
MPNPDTYTSAQRLKMRKIHAEMMALGRPPLTARFGAELAGQMLETTTPEFERLIPEIPYVGGSANSFTELMIQSASLLALYRVLQQHGQTTEEIGAVVRRMAEDWASRYPRPVRALLGRLYLSRFWRERTRRKAQASQQRHYPGEFVYEVVEPNGHEFEWGVNYLECGVVKFFKAQNAQPLTPYMCILDYLLFPSIGIDLQRTQTLAQGCTHCDFRFRRGQTPAGLPNLPEFG